MTDQDFQAALYASYTSVFKGNVGRALNHYNFNEKKSSNYSNNSNSYYRTAGVRSQKLNNNTGIGRLAKEGITPANTNKSRSNNSDILTSSFNSSSTPRSSVQAKPAQSIVYGSDSARNVSKLSARTKSTKVIGTVSPLGIKRKKQANGIGHNAIDESLTWFPSTEGKGRARMVEKTEIQLEGLSANSLYIIQYKPSAVLLNSTTDFIIDCKCKCVGSVYFMLQLNCSKSLNKMNEQVDANSSELSYLAITMSTANKCWNLELKRKNRGINSILATAEDSSLKSSEYYSIQIIVKRRKISLIVNQHRFFNEFDLSTIDSGYLTGTAIGIGVIRSKANIQNWKYTASSNNSAVNSTNNGDGINISEQTLRVFGGHSTINSDNLEEKMNSDTETGTGNEIKHDDIPVPKPRYSGPESRDLIDLIESSIIDRDLGISFDDIASLEEPKQILKESIIVPLMLPNFFQGIREPTRGVLLYGPAGTGKTLLAKAVASVAEVTFFNVDSSILTSKWRGESEKLVSTLFNMARYYSPSIIFLDEIDALFLERGTASEHEASRAFKSVMFSQIDGLYSTVNTITNNNQNKNIMIIGTSNHPWSLDVAIRRRLEKRIYIPLPNITARKQQFLLHTKSIKLSDDVNFDELAKLTEGYSGADLKILCREAALLPVRTVIQQLNPTQIKALNGSSALEYAVTQKEFLTALKNIQPSVSTAETEKYVRWQQEFGSG